MLHPHEHKKNHPGMQKGHAPDTLLRPENRQAPIFKHKSELKSDLYADAKTAAKEKMAT